MTIEASKHGGPSGLYNEQKYLLTINESTGYGEQSNHGSIDSAEPFLNEEAWASPSDGDNQ